MLLYHHGFQVGRFISLERIVEQHKVTYYEALASSSVGWHDTEHSLVPWWSFFLSMVKQAHSDLDQRLQAADSGAGKTELVQRAVFNSTGDFALSDIVASCPSVSSQLVKRVLADLKRQGRVTLRGRGRGARWRLT